MYVGQRLKAIKAKEHDLGFARSADLSSNLTGPPAWPAVTPGPAADSFKVNMTSYEQYGVCQFSLTDGSNATMKGSGGQGETTSGSVKVDQVKDKKPSEWGFSNPALYAPPLGSNAAGQAVALGLTIMTSLAVAVAQLA